MKHSFCKGRRLQNELYRNELYRKNNINNNNVLNNRGDRLKANYVVFLVYLLGNGQNQSFTWQEGLFHTLTPHTQKQYLLESQL